MKLKDTYRKQGSKFLTACDIESPVVGTIQKAEFRKLGDQEKVVLQFMEPDIGPLPLNVTNTRRLEEIVGDCDLEDLPGKRVELYKDRVPFQGKLVDAVRLRRPRPDGTAGDEVPAF